MLNYNKKRDFSQTPEPRGKKKKTGLKRFVIQKHAARNLHYDFRLEIQGVLKSWAVPKQPSNKIGVKRLAVQTEDHPVDYIDFEGVIPKAQYGAGKVEIWDSGTYELLEKKPKSLKFILKGKRLKGPFVLFNFKDDNWFMFKMKDKKEHQKI